MVDVKDAPGFHAESWNGEEVVRAALDALDFPATIEIKIVGPNSKVFATATAIESDDGALLKGWHVSTMDHPDTP